MPDVTSPLNLTAENILIQLFSNFIDVKMSTPNEGSQDCTMDLSLVSLVFGVYCVR